MTAWFHVGTEAYLDGAALVCALAGMGLGVGVLTGLFGVGGAFLVTPLLNVLFGIPYPVAVGSSLSFTIGTSASGWARHVRLRNFEPLSMLLLTLGAMVGVVFGALLNGYLKSMFGRGGSENYTLVMHGLFVAVLLLTAYMVVHGGASARGGRSVLQRAKLPPNVRLKAADLDDVSLPGIVAVGLLIGVTKGLLGIGGGVLFMPLLVVVVGLTAHQAVGTSLGVVVFSSIVGTIVYGHKGDVNLWIVMSLLVGSTVGIQIGAWLCQKLHARRLRQYFAVVVLLTAGLVAADIARRVLAS
jgi:uncharacterized membrane protein YfcA